MIDFAVIGSGISGATISNKLNKKYSVKVFEKAKEPKFSYFPDDDDQMMDYNQDLLKTLSMFFKTIV